MRVFLMGQFCSSSRQSTKEKRQKEMEKKKKKKVSVTSAGPALRRRLAGPAGRGRPAVPQFDPRLAGSPLAPGPSAVLGLAPAGQASSPVRGTASMPSGPLACSIARSNRIGCSPSMRSMAAHHVSFLLAHTPSKGVAIKGPRGSSRGEIFDRPPAAICFLL
jgi:hypothetical protein